MPQSTREGSKRTTKARLNEIAKELRALARGLGHDRKLQDHVERAAEHAEDARDLMRKRGRTQPRGGAVLDALATRR